MQTSSRPPALQQPVGVEAIEEVLQQASSRLQIMNQVEPGHGVVPVFGDGGVLLRPGEVAIYKEERAYEFCDGTPPGLYCLERQRPVACSPLPDSPRIIEREVVYVRPAMRQGLEAGCWEYVSLHSKVIRGTRRYARPEGPFYPWALGTYILGPVVGIYLPTSFAGEC
ncbi:MAG TPA: hypothetical protein VF463_19095 [Sphingobium sp.]